MRRHLPWCLASTLVLALVGCQVDHRFVTGHIWADLALLASRQNASATTVMVGDMHSDTEERTALLLQNEDDETTRSAEIAVDTLPPDGRLVYSYYAAPPVLNAGEIRLSVSVRRDDGKVIAQAEHRLAPSLGHDIAQVFIDFLGGGDRDGFRDFSLDLTDQAGLAATVKFTVRATMPPDEIQEDFEDKYGFPMPTPFAIASPRVLGETPRREGPERAGSPFNVVLFVVDGLRADAVGAYGYGRPTTPNIDRVAAEGLLMERAYAPANATRESLLAVLTGRAPSTLGLVPARRTLLPTERAAARLLTTDPIAITDNPPPDRERLDSLPRYLGRLGYATGLVGADADTQGSAPFGVDAGFRWSRTFHHAVTDTRDIAEAAAEYIRAHRDLPFFLTVHLRNGRGPLRPPDRFRGRWDAPIDPDPRVWPDIYDGEIAYADERIGRLLDLVDQVGLHSQTLVAVIGGHGEGFEEGHPRGHGHSLYDGETRVPFIVRLPGRVPVGRRLAGPTTTADLYPTILELLDDPLPAALAGRGLIGRLDAATFDEAVYLESADASAWIEGKQKLIVKEMAYENVTGDPVDGGHLMELYDLDNDPSETTNLVDEQPYRAATLARRLLDHRRVLVERRERQIAQLTELLPRAATLYPDRFVEKVHVRLNAGAEDRRFYGTVRAGVPVASFHGYDADAGDRLDPWPSGVGLSFAVAVPAGQSRQFAFTPWPPDAPIAISILDNRGPVNPNRVHAGPYRLPYVDNPAQIGTMRDVVLLAAPDAPFVDADNDHGADIWYADRDAREDARAPAPEVGP
ncbi:MAG: sulfatase [Deltaproteobacteria bacterium]|nr:sulfatase [Deltaproteobacteria bacterium]